MCSRREVLWTPTLEALVFSLLISQPFFSSSIRKGKGLIWLHRLPLFLSDLIQPRLHLYSSTFLGLSCLNIVQRNSFPLWHPAYYVTLKAIWVFLSDVFPGFISLPEFLEDVALTVLFYKCVYISLFLTHGSFRTLAWSIRSVYL